MIIVNASIILGPSQLSVQNMNTVQYSEGKIYTVFIIT